MNSLKIIVALLTLAGFSACVVDRKFDEEDVNPEPVSIYTPAGFPPMVYDFSNNPFTQEKFELGRKLFYDPLLSLDNSISCGSCHQQFAAFSNFDHALSHGIYNQLGTRNAPPIYNLIWHTSFMWDGGVNHLEIQPLNPIQNPVEMGETLPNIINKLNASVTYRNLFTKAYGSDTITSQGIFRAFAQFMGAMISADSKFDQYKAGTATLTADELAGYNLFKTKKCNDCHKEPLFTDLTYRNNGLDNQFILDAGRARITLLPADSGLFKVPSLRNVELTLPYMHDGRFQTLADVLEHYNNGIKSSSTLDPLLSFGIPLNATEKQQLIAFLKSLTDKKFTSNKALSETN